MRTRALLILLTVLSLLLSACSLPDPMDQTQWTGRVGAEVNRVQVGRAVVTFPEGVAPSGTKATIKVTSAAETAPLKAVSLSPAIEITLDGDLEPAKPVQITIPLHEDGPNPSTITDQYWLFGSATSSDGSEEFLTGSYDQTSNTFSMTADHFTSFRILGIDVGDVMGEVRTAIMQGLGLEFPAPDCTDDAINIAGTKYEVFSYPEAHLCLDDDQGNLVVTAHPAIGMPYIITTNPQSDAASSPTEVILSTSGMIVLADALGLTRGDGTTGLFPGVKATFALDGAPTALRLNFQQEPGLLLMTILAKTLDVLGLTSIDALENLQCLADVFETRFSLNNGIRGEAVGTFANAFFSCAENAVDLSPLGKFLLAAIGTAPGLLVTAVIGIINEFTGAGHRSVDLLISRSSVGASDSGAPAWAPCPNPVWAARAVESVAARCGDKLWVSYDGQDAQSLAIDPGPLCGGVTPDGLIRICVDDDFITSMNNDDTNASIRTMHEVIEYWTIDSQDAVGSDGTWVLSTAGFGPLRVGLPVPHDLKSQFDDGWECYGPKLRDPSNGDIEIWTEDGTVDTEVRALILADDTARTRSGAHIGTSLEALKQMYSSKLNGPVPDQLTNGEVYYVHDDAADDGSLSVYFEVIDNAVVGVSLQHSIFFNQLGTVSDRVCGGP